MIAKGKGKIRAKLFALCLVVSAGAACGDLFEPAAAVVNGNKITVGEVDAEIDRFKETTRFEELAAQGNQSTIERGLEQSYLTLLIREAVLSAEADKRDIVITASDVDERIEELKGEFGSESEFQEALEQEGLNLEQLEFRARVQLLEERLGPEVTAGAGPSEQELRDYYEANITDFQQVGAQHILVSDLRLATRLARRLQLSSADDIDRLFARLAKRYSEDPSNANDGGDLGTSSPDQFPAPFAAALESLEVGEISDPVRTDAGYHVIRVTERRVTPFEQARSEIEQTVGGDAEEEAYQEWLRSAFEEADVRVRSTYGELDLETLAVRDPTAEDVPAAEAPASPAVSPTPAP
jgi:parvulin-like peptidyl-prolyl isomerase